MHQSARLAIAAFVSVSGAYAQGETVAQGFWNFRVSDLVTIAAVLLAPLIAVHIQWRLQLRREHRDRKLSIFKTLMTTRGTPLSVDHVAALNSVEVEFHGQDKDSKAVVGAWRKYLDHLNTPPPTNNDGQVEQSEQNRWNDDGARLFTDLLQALAVALGYEFDELLLKKGGYSPKRHGDVEFDQLVVMRGLANLFLGRGELPMRLVLSEEEAADQAKIRDLTISYFEGKRPLPVVVVEQPTEEGPDDGAPKPTA